MKLILEQNSSALFSLAIVSRRVFIFAKVSLPQFPINFIFLTIWVSSRFYLYWTNILHPQDSDFKNYFDSDKPCVPFQRFPSNTKYDNFCLSNHHVNELFAKSSMAGFNICGSVRIIFVHNIHIMRSRNRPICAVAELRAWHPKQKMNVLICSFQIQIRMMINAPQRIVLFCRKLLHHDLVHKTLIFHYNCCKYVKRIIIRGLASIPDPVKARVKSWRLCRLGNTKNRHKRADRRLNEQSWSQAHRMTALQADISNKTATIANILNHVAVRKNDAHKMKRAKPDNYFDRHPIASKDYNEILSAREMVDNSKKKSHSFT